jgi:hypothetical protein
MEEFSFTLSICNQCAFEIEPWIPFENHAFEKEKKMSEWQTTKI